MTDWSEKREHPRVKVTWDCTFGADEDTPRSGKVTSLSVRGCFVKTKAWVTRGQSIHVKVWQADWKWLPLRGTVHYHLEGVGFGMLFTDLDEETAAAIKRLVGRESPAPPAAGAEGGDDAAS